MLLNLKILVMLITVFCLRPSAFGQQFTTYGLIFAFVALFINYIEMNISVKATKKTIIIPKLHIYLIISLTLLWSYLMIHGVFVDSNGQEFTVKALYSNLIIGFIFVVLLSDLKSNYLFFKTLIIIIILMCLSFCITFILSKFVGGIDNLKIISLNIEGYNNSGSIFFPFTQIYGVLNFGDVQLFRAQGFFRESGIFQAFIIWALFNLKYFKLNNWYNKLLLIIGLVSTFSTIGIAICFIIWSLRLFMYKNKILAIAILSLGLYSALYAPYIGVISKAETHGASIDDRSNATTRGLENLSENIVGTGLYNQDEFYIENGNINLLAMSYTLGLLGLLLVLLMYFLPLIVFKSNEDKKKYLLSILPFFLTLLFSQPILDAPFIFIMLLANLNYKSLKNGGENENII